MARPNAGDVLLGRTLEDRQAAPGQVFVAIPMDVDAARRVLLLPADRRAHVLGRFRAMVEEHARPYPDRIGRRRRIEIERA